LNPLAVVGDIRVARDAIGINATASNGKSEGSEGTDPVSTLNRRRFSLLTGAAERHAGASVFECSAPELIVVVCCTIDMLEHDRHQD
jgi:hypothetical protein